jgi:hypothetical protein
VGSGQATICSRARLSHKWERTSDRRDVLDHDRGQSMQLQRLPRCARNHMVCVFASPSREGRSSLGGVKARHRRGSEGTLITPFSPPYLKGEIQEEIATLRWRGYSRLLLPLKMPARHVIIADSEAKPESRNQTPSRTEDTSKPVPERPGPDQPRRLYNRDLKK